MAQFDLQLPKFGEGDLDDAKQRRRIMSYLYKLDEQLRFVLNNLDAENFTEEFQQTVGSGGGGGITSYAELENELGKLSTQIRQTAAQIELKADAEELNELGDAVSQVETDLKVIAGKIESTVTRTEFDELGNQVAANRSAITQTAKGIRSEVADEVAGLNSTINQTAGAIRAEVKNTAAGLQSQINQTPEKIELAVGNVHVGGTNYLLNSGSAVSNATYNIANYQFGTMKPVAGEIYTLRIWGSLGSGRTGLKAYNTNGYINLGDLTDNGDGTFTSLITWKNKAAADSSYDVTMPTQLQIYQFPRDRTSVSTITRIKLEKGNKATDWSPAPEDVQTGNENLLDDAELTISNGWIANYSSWYARNGKRFQVNGADIDTSKDISANFGEIYISPGSYTVSCYAWQWNLGGAKPTLYFDMHSPDRTTFAQNVMSTTLEDTASGGAVRKYTGTLNVTGYTGLVSVRFIIVGTFSQGDIGITEWKLERGNNATDWSPYREQFSAGTNVLINKDRFSVTTPEMNVNITSADGTERMLTIDKNGIHAQSIDCPNVAPRYDGPGTLYVNPNATSAQIAAGNYFRSMADAFAALSEKQIAYSVTINLAAGMTEYGNVRLRGVSGPYWVYINGNSSSRANLVGQLDLSYNKCMVRVQYLNVNSDVNARAIFIGGATSMAIIQHCTVTGKGVSGTVDGESNTGSVGVYAEWGSNVQVTGCELYDTYRSLYVQTLGQMQSISNKGNCTIGANRSQIFVSGTAPSETAAGEWSQVQGGKIWVDSGVTIDQGSKPSAPTVTTKTVSYKANNSDVYAGGGWNNYSAEDIYQGYTTALGEHRGCFWFDNATIRSALNGKTIKQATLTLYQMSGVGRNQPVQVNLEGITATSGTGSSPIGKPEYGVIGTTLGVNQATTFTLPTAVITDLVKGTINGLMLRTGETSVMKNDDNSYHYARFAGKATAANAPVLTVVYA